MKGGMYVQHVTVEGLATAGGIQGNVANAAVTLLKHHKIDPVMKWVDDDFILFMSPILTQPTSNTPHHFAFSLSSILDITGPLGIPWHPLMCKGHDFQTSCSYIGFNWDLSFRTVSLSNVRHIHLLSKPSPLLSIPTPCVNMKTVASIHRSLQHITDMDIITSQLSLGSYQNFQMNMSFTTSQNLVLFNFLGVPTFSVSPTPPN